MSRTRHPTLARAVWEMVTQRLKGVRVAMPAAVVEYYPEQGTADVQPLIQEPMQGEVVTLPVITNVPVVWPRSSTAYLSMPLAAGDQVLLVFADRSLDRWLTTGGEVDPEDTRIHSLSDAIAIPGLFEMAMGIADPDSDMIRLGFRDGALFANVKIDPATGDLFIENGPTAVIRIGSQTALRPTIPHTEAKAAIDALFTTGIGPLIVALNAATTGGSWDDSKAAAVAAAATTATASLATFSASFAALANSKVLI